MTGLKETLIENIFFNLPKKSHMHDPLNIMVPDFTWKFQKVNKIYMHRLNSILTEKYTNNNP